MPAKRIFCGHINFDGLVKSLQGRRFRERGNKENGLFLTFYEFVNFDALVLVTNCDKITPAMLMIALRLNIPTVVLSGGQHIYRRSKQNTDTGGRGRGDGPSQR